MSPGVNTISSDEQDILLKTLSNAVGLEYSRELLEVSTVEYGILFLDKNAVGKRGKVFSRHHGTTRW